MNEKIEHQSPDSVVEDAKKLCHIDRPNDDMSNAEIQAVSKCIGALAPDTVWIDSQPKFGRMGWSIMLSITLLEFPWFYEEHGLSQLN